MNDEFLTINIKKFINEGESGESFLKEIFSSFISSAAKSFIAKIKNSKEDSVW